MNFAGRTAPPVTTPSFPLDTLKDKLRPHHLSKLRDCLNTLTLSALLVTGVDTALDYEPKAARHPWSLPCNKQGRHALLHIPTPTKGSAPFLLLPPVLPLPCTLLLSLQGVQFIQPDRNRDHLTKHQRALQTVLLGFPILTPQFPPAARPASAQLSAHTFLPSAHGDGCLPP